MNGIAVAPLLIVLILSLSTSVWGVDPATYVSQYRHSAWRMKDGPLRGEPDFKVVEEMQAPHFPDARALAADRTAGIWLGLMNGDLARYRNGNIEIFPFHHDSYLTVFLNQGNWTCCYWTCCYLHRPRTGRKIQTNYAESLSHSIARNESRVSVIANKEVSNMPIAQELTIRMQNRPGSLGKVCRELADNDVTIKAFQSIPADSTILVCIVVDKPEAAKAVLDREGITFTEVEVAEARLQYGPGELTRAASKLGEANININYAYSGVEPSTRAPLVIFGVTDVGRAANILDHTATTAAGA